MKRHFRKGVWLAVASLVILSLTIGATLAHEGRPVGDYRFIVGWQEEPAYEGVKNAASVQISEGSRKRVRGTRRRGRPLFVDARRAQGSRQRGRAT